MAISIRNMAISDISAVQSIAYQTWHSTYQSLIPETIQDQFLSMAYSNTMLEKRLQHSLFLVAEDAHKIVGFAEFKTPNDIGESELSAIYIDPSYQGQQIGTQLLNEGIRQLTQVNFLIVEVEKDNQIGLQFYQAKGFKVIKEYDDNFNGHILKTVQMKLEI